MLIAESAERHEARIIRRIKQGRKKRGWSQEKLAREAEISRETIRLMETGLRFPTLKTLHALANAFGVSIEELIADDSRGISVRNGYPERQLVS